MTINPTTFSQVIIDGGRHYGHNPALISKDRRVSYVELGQMSGQLAQALRERGLKPGDRVAIVLSNSWSFVVSIFAVIMARAIAVPLDRNIRPRNFLHVVNDCGVKTLIIDDGALPRLVSSFSHSGAWQTIFVQGDSSLLPQPLAGSVCTLEEIFQNKRIDPSELAAEVDPEAVVSISYTSGSTGTPKGVVHSHQSWLSGSQFTAAYFDLTERDKMVIPLPLHHAYSFRHIIAYLIKGASLVIAEDIYEALKLLKAERPTAFLLVPVACNILLNYFKPLLQECGAFLDFVSVGTAPLPVRQLHELQLLLPQTRIHLPYGLTEARVGFLESSDGAVEKRIFAVQPSLEVRVVDEHGRPVGPGETGQIVLKGKGLMAGYWHDTAEDRRRRREWGFPTGDLGRVNQEQDICLLGRSDDMINIDGRLVAPSEVEGVLNQYPAVIEAAVGGVPDPNGLLDQQLKAWVVLEKGAQVSVDTLKVYCQQHLEPYKVPSSIVFEASLQRSGVGKVLKNIR